MTNKELQEILKKYPEDALIGFEYSKAISVEYIEEINLINIE